MPGTGRRELPGRSLALTWQHDPAAYGPGKYRKACKYEAFVPLPIAELLPLSLDAELAGLISEAESRIRNLNAVALPGLAPLARLLLRTESIASSKVEGMQLGIRELARSEAKLDVGEKIGTTAAEIIANIDAMELAVQDAAEATEFTADQIVAIHRKLLQGSTHAHI